MGNNALTDDELLVKCGKDEAISSSDLGVTKSDSNGLVTLNEGLNVLIYTNNSNNEE